MPDKLPVLRAKEVVRALLRAGFYIHHQTGSRARLLHQDKPELRVTVPIHAKDIPSSLLKRILRTSLHAGRGVQEALMNFLKSRRAGVRALRYALVAISSLSAPDSGPHCQVSSKAFIQRQIRAMDAGIDRLVYGLYAFTVEGIALEEGQESEDRSQNEWISTPLWPDNRN